MGYRIKDWKTFQHFKDRTPPWIKLYRDILDDPDWHALDGEAAKFLVMLWLVASEDKEKLGRIPNSRKLAFRLHMKESEVEKLFLRLSHWMIQDDINSISEGYQSDAPEERREETEGETETEGEFMSGASPDVSVPKVNGFKSTAKTVLVFLNEKAGRDYQPVESNLTLIVSRLKEGYSESDLKQIVARKCREWGSDEKMAQYLRPSTLFNAQKCAQYRGELV